MRVGENKPYRQSGLIYLSVLILVMVMGIGMLKATTLWETKRQRENEAQLLFVGNQVRLAIASYYNHGQRNKYPLSFEVLLEDKRSGKTVPHLRKMYADPMSQNQDWGVEKTQGGEIMGVYSTAKNSPMKKQGFSIEDETFAGKNSYREWIFAYRPSK